MVNFGITCIVFSLFLMFTTTFLLITTSQSPKVSIFFTRNIIHITTKHTPTRVVVILQWKKPIGPFTTPSCQAKELATTQAKEMMTFSYYR